MLRTFCVVIAALVSFGIAIAAEQTAMPSSVSLLPTFAQAKPAVDGLNGKLDVFGGAGQSNALSINSIGALSPYTSVYSLNWNGIGGAVGTVTVPLGHKFGGQIDLGSGAFGDRANGSGAGHLFWRDPDYGLAGIYGSGFYSSVYGGATQWNAAGEFERFIGPITARGLLGIQGFAFNTISAENQYFVLVQTPRQPDRFFDKLQLTYYPLDDLALSLGHIYTRGFNGIHGEIEYLLSEFRGTPTAPAVYISASYGWNDSSNVMAGLRVYFGNHDKSLIRRHREDDPKTDALTNMFAFIAAGQQRRYASPPVHLRNPLANFLTRWREQWKSHHF